MKKLVLILIGFCFFTNLKAQNSYYWYNNTKQVLNRDNSRTFITVKNLADAEEVTNELKASGIEVDDFQSILLSSGMECDDNKYWTYVYSSNFNSEVIVYSGPSYILENNTHVSISHLFYVKVKSLDDVDLLDSMAEVYNVSILGNNQFMPKWYTLSVTSESSGNTLDIANSFFESGLFENATPDIMVDDNINCATDPLFTYQWGLKNIGQGGLNNVDINWCDVKQLTTGNPNIIVAVLDQGIQLNHPDITNLCSISYDSESGTSPSIIRGNHGTLCAGIIGATTDNNLGTSGIASSCKLMSISNSLQGTPDSRMKRADGINFAWLNGASIISNSWVSSVKYDVIDDAINLAVTQGRNGKGCVVVFSSGNDNGNEVKYPSSLPNVISVGAISPCGERKSPSSCDGETFWGSNYGSGLDVVAPGVLIPTTDINSGYVNNYNGTSSACPHVAGVAALVLSVNPNLTYVQVKNIIEQTAQKIGNYSYNNSSAHPNGTWNNQVGYGLVDAYAAVNAALDIDLYTRDNESDNGTEPNSISETGIKDSPDIWLRRNADGGTLHQLARQGAENHVYVRIHNRGNNASLGNDVVKLYIKTGGFNTNNWSSGWTMIGSTGIPQIASGSSAIVRIDATFPYSIYPLSNLPYVGYAMLTRIESEYDGLHIAETSSTSENVLNNNNISFDNVRNADVAIIEDDVVTYVAFTALDNPTNKPFGTTLKFSSPSNEAGDPLFKEAEIRLIFPKTLVSSWGSSYSIDGAEKVNDSTFLIKAADAKLENISIPANYEGYMMAQINFLTEEYSEKDKYEYIVDQYDPVKGDYQNGLVMIVDKTLRSKLFEAEGGENVVANANTPVNLSAGSIGEDAVYNWYNASGVLVNSGQNISVTSSATEKYTLEVIAKADGYKDYDSVYVIRTLGNIVGISPNPTSGQTVVTYNLASSVSAASIVVINSSGLQVYSSAIDISATTHTLNLQNLTAGQYSVRLVSSTGEVMDTKTLIVQ